MYPTVGILTALITTTLATAPVTNDNPQGAQYIAALPVTCSVSGSVVASSTSNGTGVGVQVSLSSLPSQGGPFRES